MPALEKPALSAPGPPAGESLTISCDECAMHATEACDDCVVSFIVGRDPDDAVVVDAVEAKAVRVLAGAGLVPQLRYRRASEGA